MAFEAPTKEYQPPAHLPEIPVAIKKPVEHLNSSSLIEDLIVFDNVTKRFPNDRGLFNINFTLSAGEFVFITGATGSGKTTLVRLLQRAIKPDKGSVIVSGEDIATLKPAKYRRNIGFAFQHHDLLPDYTAAENIVAPLKMLYYKKAAMEERLKELLILFDLEYTRDRFPAELSGGEQARLTLARAIAHKPPVLVADEPTGHLDPITALHVLRTLNRVAMMGTAVIVITHDNDIVDLLRKRVLVLNEGHLVSDEFQGYRLR
jgi:cell division transport system ATP-binding protein